MIFSRRSRSLRSPDDTVEKHGEGLRVVSVKLARPCHTDAAAAVGVIHKHQFAPVRVRLLQRWKLSWLGSEDFGSLFLVLSAWFFA